MMYRVRRVQIGNSGEIAWESKRRKSRAMTMQRKLGAFHTWG